MFVFDYWLADTGNSVRMVSRHTGIDQELLEDLRWGEVNLSPPQLLKLSRLTSIEPNEFGLTIEELREMR